MTLLFRLCLFQVGELTVLHSGVQVYASLIEFIA